MAQAHGVLDGQLLSSLESADAVAAEAALETIYRHHAGAVFNFITHCTGDASLAIQVVEEVFVHLWEEPQSCHPSQGSLRSCLIKEAFRRWSALGGSEPSQNGLGAVLPSLGRSDAGHPWPELRFEERLSIGLAHFGEMTIQQVASLLDVEDEAVMRSVTEGLRRLAANA